MNPIILCVQIHLDRIWGNDLSSSLHRFLDPQLRSLKKVESNSFKWTIMLVLFGTLLVATAPFVLVGPPSWWPGIPASLPVIFFTAVTIGSGWKTHEAWKRERDSLVKRVECGPCWIDVSFETTDIHSLWNQLKGDLQELLIASIVVCQGEHGWDNYLLLHHFDSTVELDKLPTQGDQNA